MQATADVLVQKYFPYEFMQRIVNHSNAYVEECKRRMPTLDVWKRKKDSQSFTLSSMYHFFGIIYYMGVVQLPSKYDYWSTHPLMPTHDI